MKLLKKVIGQSILPTNTLTTKGSKLFYKVSIDEELHRFFLIYY